MKRRSSPPSVPLWPLAIVATILGLTTIVLWLEVSPRFSAQTSGTESSSSSPFIEPVLPLTDVDWRSPEGSAVYFLLTHGVIQGFPDRTFRGEELVSRAELVKMLVLAGGFPISPVHNNGRFHDVPEEEWYTPFVMTAAIKGIAEGYPTQRILFKPSLSVNTAEFLKMLTRTFHLREKLLQSYKDVPAGLWYEPFAGAAWQYELLPLRPATFLQPHRLLTRREVAIAIDLLFHQPKRRRLPSWLPPPVPTLPFVPLPQPLPSSSALPPPTPAEENFSPPPMEEPAPSSEEIAAPFGGETAGAPLEEQLSSSPTEGY